MHCRKRNVLRFFPIFRYGQGQSAALLYKVPHSQLIKKNKGKDKNE
jgi:hypothetical protein